jgi:hypothetical protein
MIHWGSRYREDVVALGQFFCPGCRADAPFKHLRKQKLFTLYFIPLFPTETLGEVVRCDRCKGEFQPVVLTHTRERILATLDQAGQ